MKSKRNRDNAVSTTHYLLISRALVVPIGQLISSRGSPPQGEPRSYADVRFSILILSVCLDLPPSRRLR